MSQQKDNSDGRQIPLKLMVVDLGSFIYLGVHLLEEGIDRHFRCSKNTCPMRATVVTTQMTFYHLRCIYVVLQEKRVPEVIFGMQA